MQLHLWGTDFRRSHSEFRSQLYIPEELRESKIRQLIKLGFEDLVYLHTCNRVEFITTCPDFYEDSRSKWENLLTHFNLSKSAFHQGYHFEGKAAIRHLTRVASSLESLVVGEPQILGQIKTAYSWTLDQGLPASSHLQQAFHFIFNTAKKVRTDSQIGENPVSVASLAIQKLEQMELQHPLTRIVVVGRGPMSQTLLKWLRSSKPLVPIIWVNRTMQNLTHYLNESNVTRMSLADFLESPPYFSHLFTATAAQSPIFDESFFNKITAPCLMFDLAHPPDIVAAPAPHCRIGFEQLIEEASKNEQLRSHAIEMAEKIIVEALRNFYQEQKEAPLLKDFSKIEQLFQAELLSALESLEQLFPKDLAPKIEQWATKLVKRNLHLSRNHLREILKQFTKKTLSQTPE